MLDLHPCRRKDRYAVVPFTSKDEYQISHTDPGCRLNDQCLK